jgi:hypothetical protein
MDPVDQGVTVVRLIEQVTPPLGQLMPLLMALMGLSGAAGVARALLRSLRRSA